MEAAFRRHAAALNDAARIEGQRHVAIDGKTLRHSFDDFLDRRTAHVLGAFAADTALVLAHLDCDDKSNGISSRTAPAWHAWPGWRRGHRRRHALSKKAFEQAAAGGVHLIAQVKANQPSLHRAVAALLETAAPLDRTLTADRRAPFP